MLSASARVRPSSCRETFTVYLSATLMMITSQLRGSHAESRNSRSSFRVFQLVVGHVVSPYLGFTGSMFSRGVADRRAKIDRRFQRNPRTFGAKICQGMEG